MKLPNKFFIVINVLIYLLLILSFIYLFIAMIVKYNLFFNIKFDFKFLVSLMGSIATVILAILTLQMVREMKQSREEDRRPYVYVDFVFDTSVILIMVKNSGRSGAKNIKFSFSPALVSSKNEKISEINMFKEGIKFLPPEREIKTWFDMGPSFYKSDLPKTYNVEIEYQNAITDKKYRESFVLDFNTRLGIATITRHTLHDLVEELRKINSTLKGSGSGFLIENAEQRSKRYKQQREEMLKLQEQNKEKDKKT